MLVEEPRTKWNNDGGDRTVRVTVAANPDSLCPVPESDANITSIDWPVIENLSDRYYSHFVDEEIEAQKV